MASPEPISSPELVAAQAARTIALPPLELQARQGLTPQIPSYAELLAKQRANRLVFGRMLLN